ncbi:hypothetical protein VTN77DRAFT_501 [Rasamsonia byssochlamydoides]|uniref:uncharacterized protein n=1 Tax=Rasamsonia byssochlamydoides TaxID=89139 RepID=UPI003742A61F
MLSKSLPPLSSPLRLRFLVLGGCFSLIVSALLIYGVRNHFLDDYSYNYHYKSLDNGIFSSSSQYDDRQTCTAPSTAQNNSSLVVNIDSNVTWEFLPTRDADNYGLSDAQCQLAFPKLFVEIDKSVALRTSSNRPITWKELNSRKVGDGMVRVIVHRGELYIVSFGAMPYTFSRAKATLHSLHRALIAFPNRAELPSVEFIFTTEDFVSDEPAEEASKGPIFAYSKRDGDHAVWLMPDFGYWSWPEVKVGPYRDVRRRIAAVDEELAFQDKKRQLLWRGSLATAPELRSKLLAATRGKHWASVKAVDWDDDKNDKYNHNNDLLPIEDHCRYMFLAHTEGRSFSGRGKYLHNCRSVVISHSLIWREAHHSALIPSGPEANYVEVSRDFADLEAKIEYLLDHPDVAERIANNSIKTFRDRYLTPAAEACYWRYLIRRYAEVCDFEPELYERDFWEKEERLRGVPYESWLLG